MILFLASRVIHPKTLETLKDYLGGFEGKTMAYIPTAANGEDGWGSWKQGESWTVIQDLGFDITLVQLEDYRNNTVVEHLKGKDIIWMAGGACGYLMYWIRRCELDKYLPELLSDKTVYVGSSAGSMITAKSLHIAEWYEGEIETGASVIPGLGLVDFDFYPHYQDDQLDYIQQHYHGNNLYLVKDGEEIIVEDNHITVVGEQRIVNGVN